MTTANSIYVAPSKDIVARSREICEACSSTRKGDGLGHCVVCAGLPGQPGATESFNPSTSELAKIEDLTFIVPIMPRLEKRE